MVWAAAPRIPTKHKLIYLPYPRHSVPFGSATQVWPATVVELGQTHSDGNPCAFALNDALTEAGWTEWAAHLGSPEHANGCRAPAGILGRK